MNLEAEGGHSLSIPFFLISFESKFDSTYLALSIVLSYAVSLMINAYNGQYIQFWGSEGNHVLYVISVTNKVMCMRVCVGGVWVVYSLTASILCFNFHLVHHSGEKGCSLVGLPQTKQLLVNYHRNKKLVEFSFGER